MKKVFGYMKEHFSTFLIFGLSIIAIVSAIALPGLFCMLSKSAKDKWWAEINLVGLIFGSSKLHYRIEGNVSVLPFSGGISYFAIATFVLFIAGITLLILDLVKPGKNFKIFGLSALILSCVTVFLVPLAGTPINIVADPSLPEVAGEDIGSWTFREFVLVRKYKIGIAAYFYCMSLILVCLSQFFKELGKILKAKGFGQKKY